MKTFKAGYVTAVVAGRLVHGVVGVGTSSDTELHGRTLLDENNAAAPFTVRTADWNVTWCYGRVTEDDETGAAMLAAAAMTRRVAVDLETLGQQFINGEISEEQWRANLDLWDVQFAEEIRR